MHVPCYVSVRKVEATLVLNEGWVGLYEAVGQATEGFYEPELLGLLDTVGLLWRNSYR